MGFDSLELIRRIEEEFSIYLPEEELREVYTIGNLYNLLLRLLRPTPDCLTSKAFCRVRRAMINVVGTSRNSIRPSTFMDDLFDQKLIRQQWHALADKSGLQLPSLRHTAMWKHWMQIVSALLAFIVCLTSYKLLSRFPAIDLDNSLVFGAFVLSGFVLWGFLYPALLRWTAFRGSVLPTLTIGELARVVLSMNQEEFAHEAAHGSKLTQDLIWIRLVSVFCDQMGFKPEDVVPSASIMVDLAEV